MTLDGEWTLRPSRIEKNNYGITDSSSFEMTLPGSIQDALIEEMVVPDPYYGCNELELSFIGRSDWDVERVFSFRKKPSCRYILKLEKVDTVVSLYIEGRFVAVMDNEHEIHHIDVTDFLRSGDNRIRFSFRSSEKVAMDRAGHLDHEVPYSKYKYSSPHQNLVRKTQCNAGWDWGLCLQSMGIYESLELFECQDIYVKSFSAIPVLSPDKAFWRLDFTIHALGLGDGSTASAVFEVAGLSESTEFPVKAGDNVLKYSMTVPSHKVELWWPNGMGAQNLYDVSVTFGDFSLKRRIGFRTIAVKNGKTMGGKELTICVNGRDVFCKGANWIPADARPLRMTAAKYDSLIRDARDANMNMLRLWGGGWYEKEEFYDACDRYGIMIWHDLMFSCSPYPAEKWFLDSVEREIRDQVRRLSSRTCIALWCGNNECLGSLGWYDVSKNNLPLYLRDYEKLYVEHIDHILVEEDPSRMYWPSSPCAGPGDYSDNWHVDGSGDMHFWTVWHERKDFEVYHSVKPRFCSEFGYQSFPSMSEIKSFAPSDQLFIESEVMEHHQRNDEGNSIISEMFGRYFNKPRDFASTLYLSQVQQALAIETAVTWWRSLMPYCMGTLYWQLNDVWPVSSWSSIEYSGKWKCLHYVAKRLYESAVPLLYTDEGCAHVKMANDGLYAASGILRYSLVRYDGSVVENKSVHVDVPSMTVLDIASIDLSAFDPSTMYLCASFSVGQGRDASESTLMLCRPKDAALENPSLKVSEVKKIGTHTFEITLESSAPAFFVTLDAGSVAGRFDDNCFTLNGRRAVRFRCEDEEETLKKFSAALTVFDLYSCTTKEM